jgi:hypothetical protein
MSATYMQGIHICGVVWQCICVNTVADVCYIYAGNTHLRRRLIWTYFWLCLRRSGCYASFPTGRISHLPSFGRRKVCNIDRMRLERGTCLDGSRASNTKNIRLNCAQRGKLMERCWNTSWRACRGLAAAEHTPFCCLMCPPWSNSYTLQQVHYLYLQDGLLAAGFYQWPLLEYTGNSNSVRLADQRRGRIYFWWDCNFHSYQPWRDVNPRGIITSRHRQQFSVNMWVDIKAIFCWVLMCSSVFLTGSVYRTMIIAHSVGGIIWILGNSVKRWFGKSQ